MVLVETIRTVLTWPTIVQLMMAQMSLIVLFKWQVMELLCAWVPLICLIPQMCREHLSALVLLLFQKFRLHQESSHSTSLGMTLIVVYNVSFFSSIIEKKHKLISSLLTCHFPTAKISSPLSQYYIVRNPRYTNQGKFLKLSDFLAMGMDKDLSGVMIIIEVKLSLKISLILIWSES